MTQLTQEHFDDQLEKLAQITKQGFDATATKNDLKNLATKGDLGVLKIDVDKHTERFDKIDAILDKHTSSLDTLVGRKIHKDTEAAAAKSRFQRYDRWFKELAEKIGIHLES